MFNRSVCRPDGPRLVVLVVLALVVVVRFRHLILEVLTIAGITIAALAAAAVVALAARLVIRRRRKVEQDGSRSTFRVRPPRWLRHVPRAAWCALRWHHLTRNLALAYPDRHAAGKTRRPRAIVLPTCDGVTAWVRPVPGSGRAEFDEAAEHIGDYWRVQRVSVARPRPGRLRVAGYVRDPLAVPFTEADAPAEAFTPGSDLRNLRLYLGRDEWGAHRWLSVANTPGMTISGLPGYGKTHLVRLLLRQLEARRVPHRLTIIDGKGSEDYGDLRDRCWIFTSDDLDDAAIALGQVQAGMRDRLGSILELTGGWTNGWQVGPTAIMPLDITIIDEAHSFFALDAVRGDKAAEKQVRECVHATSQIIKKGRSALQLVLVLTQKQTSDAVPTIVRDVCAIGLSFACRTRDGAVASLGEQIRQYETYCPTALNSPEYVGVCTTSLRTGQDPFTRVRVPLLTQRPSSPVVVVPDDVSELVES